MLVLLEPGHEAVEDAEQRAGGPLELDHLAGQLVDAPRDLRVAAEDLGLDLVDVVLQAGDHGGVAVDDRVQDRVQHRLGPEAQQVGVALHAAADRGQVGGLAVADGEHEVRADEHVDLAELDLLDLVQVAGGAQHHEQGVAVAFQLGSLVGDDGVLDRQLVQAELLGDGQQLRLGRPVEPDPGHRARLVAQAPGRPRPPSRGCPPAGRRGRWRRRRHSAPPARPRRRDAAPSTPRAPVACGARWRRGRHAGSGAAHGDAARPWETSYCRGRGTCAGPETGPHAARPAGDANRQTGVSRDSEVGCCSQRPHLPHPRRRTDLASLPHS